MGNIEDSDKVNIPNKIVSAKSIKPIPPKKHHKTEIVNTMHSSKLQCKVEFHKFTALQMPSEVLDDDVVA